MLKYQHGKNCIDLNQVHLSTVLVAIFTLENVSRYLISLTTLNNDQSRFLDVMSVYYLL
jgi:hypothetical protein